MLSIKKKVISKIKNIKRPVLISTIIILFLYVCSLTIWINKYDWETASNITVFYGVIGVFLSLWQANAQKNEQQKNAILLELSISEEISNNFLLSLKIDELDNGSPELLQGLKKTMHLINKISLLSESNLIDIEQLYLMSGSDLKGIIIRCIKIISGFDYKTEFVITDYILKNRGGLINIYNKIKEIDYDILLLQDKVDYICKMSNNRIVIKSE